MRDKIQEKIRRRIIRQGHKKVYINADFVDIASPDAVRKALQRLCDCGFIVREQRGDYSYPIPTRFGPLRPSSLDLAKAIARRDNVQIAHTPAQAENLLGLSTQVPMKVVFLTNGSGRTIRQTRQPQEATHKKSLLVCQPPATQINDRKANKFAYIKKKLYLYTQFCVRITIAHKTR